LLRLLGFAIGAFLLFLWSRGVPAEEIWKAFLLLGCCWAVLWSPMQIGEVVQTYRQHWRVLVPLGAVGILGTTGLSWWMKDQGLPKPERIELASTASTVLTVLTAVTIVVYHFRRSRAERVGKGKAKSR
jgi:hypothetical protein